MQLPIKQQIKAALLVMLAITLVLGLVKFIQIRRAIADAARFAPPPEVVTVVKVSTTAWRDTFQTVGSFAAIKGATLGTQESGNVVRVSFESGDRVAEGQVLLELDRSVEEANLQGALARLELAKQNLARAQTLKSQSAVSLANYEDAQAKVKQAEAEVRSIRGVIERKTIVAPFSGRAGIRAVNVGQYVNAGTPLVPLYSVDPVHFNFSVPQQVAPALRDTTENVSIVVDAFPNQTFQGAVTAVNRNINEITRAVEVQATIPNSREDLLPGMFGEVQIELGVAKEIIAVPVSSIEYAPYGNSVYIVERSQGEKGDEITSVRQQIVGLGNKRGDFVAVTSGLKAGDEVVTLGAFKLRPGAQVVIRADQSVPATLQPDVKNS